MVRVFAKYKSLCSLVNSLYQNSLSKYKKIIKTLSKYNLNTSEGDG